MLKSGKVDNHVTNFVLCTIVIGEMGKDAKMKYRYVRFTAAFMTLGLLIGCTDMQFVGTESVAPEKDTRADIVLTNISADMTSGGLVQQRVFGKQSIFSQTENELTIKEIQVTAIGEDKATRSVTQADLGQIYLADRPAEDITRNDMKFAGNVLYRNPQKDDPTTDSLQLNSELIIWDESEQKFKSPASYSMMLLPKGKTPVRQSGKSFEAAQDLTRFVVKTGIITTELDGDPVVKRQELEERFEVWRDQVEEIGKNKPVRPPLIELPPRLEAPNLR